MSWSLLLTYTAQALFVIGVVVVVAVVVAAIVLATIKEFRK